MTALRRLCVVTHGGVHDLGRVVNVLALLDLTPVRFSAVAEGHGLRVDAWLKADERQLTLCFERLRAFSAVAHASLTEAT